MIRDTPRFSFLGSFCNFREFNNGDSSNTRKRSQPTISSAARILKMLYAKSRFPVMY